VDVRLRRRSTYYGWNVLAPMLVLTTVAWAVWGLPPDALGDRMNITLTLMLTSVAYKIVVCVPLSLSCNCLLKG
jgi:hypothetical protein